jgi:choline monooxygenase
MASTVDLSPGRFVVPQHDRSTMLINSGNGISAISNICTHKRATISEGRGDIGSVITCPIHRWSWNLDGTIRGARGFKTNCTMDLPTGNTFTWNGHVFSGSIHQFDDINLLGDLSLFLSMSNYEWESSQVISYGFDWKIFMEIFLDLYHVQSFHPGLKSLTDCKTFDWVFGKNWSCQTALLNKDVPGTGWYQELYRYYRASGHYENAKYGAVWLGIYPNTMIEYYPGCMVVSTVWPDGAGRCKNHLEFYYEKGLLERLPGFADVHQKCFMVTADEDEIIGNRIQEGLGLAASLVGVHSHPTEEAGFTHFHGWLRDQTGQTTK